MPENCKGRFLIAAPQMPDPNFARTVVFITEHDERGAFGLVLNRPAALKVAKLWEAVGGDSHLASDSSAFVGGPVDTRVIHFLHSCEDLAPGSEPVIPGVYLGNDAALFGSLLERQQALREAGDPREIFRAFCGFAGWGEGQLDGELETGTWLVQDATPDLVLGSDALTLWSRVMEREGGVFALFSQMPADPELN